MSEVMAGGRLSPADFSYLFKFFKKNTILQFFLTKM